MAKRKLPPEVYGGFLRLASQVLVTVVGRDVAAAERGAIEPADSVSAERPLRADAVRNRELLITTAAAAFAAHGADVPLEDIARTAGVGIGTLYRHFPTRDSLVGAVYRHEVDVLCDSADQLLKILPPDQALAEWMQLFVRHVATKRGMLSVLKPMMSADATFYQQTRGRATDAATRLLDAGVAAGTVRSDIRGDDLLRAVGGICMSTDQERSEASERLVGLLFDGLRHGARDGSAAHATALPSGRDPSA
jgi:AcrR family transcriptional regulator